MKIITFAYVRQLPHAIIHTHIFAAAKMWVCGN
jgi:hypothetical protein